MQRVCRLETKSLQFYSAANYVIRQRYSIILGREKRANTRPSNSVWIGVDLNLDDLGRNQLPATDIDLLQNSKDRLCFRSNPRLPLVVKRAVQTRNIQVEPHGVPYRPPQCFQTSSVGPSPSRSRTSAILRSSSRESGITRPSCRA